LCIAFLGDRPLNEIEADNKTQVHTYYRSAKARARHLGYEVSYFNFFDPGMTGKRLSQILVARGIRGVIIAPFGEAMGLSEVVLDWNSFAMVMIDHALLEPPLQQVANDEFTTIGKMIQRLLDCGFRRLGIAMRSSMDEHANHFWLAGYQTFQDLTEPQYRIPHFITPKWSKTDFLSWYHNWKPEAIITINDDIVRWLREVGIRVPEDVSCSTLYWKEDRSYLSGYYQNHELIASAAVDLVVGQLNRNESGLPESEKSMLVKAVWKDGETILPKKAAEGELPLRVWKR
jgi:LacI family transcriptional regulator